jgi:hypothetical protein
LFAAFVNFIVGFAWYNPKSFGKVWMKEAVVIEESIKGAYMALIFRFSLLFGFMLASNIISLVIHQMHFFSICMHQLQGTDEAAKAMANADIANFMAKYGTEFRTFKHGVFHRLMYGLFFVLPGIGTN